MRARRLWYPSLPHFRRFLIAVSRTIVIPNGRAGVALVSFVELLVMYDMFEGSDSGMRKPFPRGLGLGGPLVHVCGMQIWRTSGLLGHMLRALDELPGERGYG